MGRGLLLSGTQFRLSATYQLPQTCADGEIAVWDGTAWVCEADGDALASLSCADGQVPEWDNTNQEWVCAEDNDSGGDITAVTAGTGLSGGGTSGDVTVSANTSYLQRRVDATCTAGSSIRVVNANGTVACEPDDDALGGLTCAAGQTAKWNGGAWACADDDTGATGEFWSLTGNAGTTAGTNFLGTTDGEPLELHVEGARALRLEPTTATPNLIGGHSGNTATAGVIGATIAGGGAAGADNRVTDDYGAIGGGRGNTASCLYTTVGGGRGNTADANGATVAGGQSNATEGDCCPEGAFCRIAFGYYQTIGGGFDNTASGNHATISGGQGNTVTDHGGTVGGGIDNQAGDAGGDASGATYATVGGGENNTASGAHATVEGGENNTAAGAHTAVGGGRANTAEGDAATASGGMTNTASAGFATVGGGENNTASGAHATVAGGAYNEAAAQYATIAGGGPYDVDDATNTNNRVTDDYGTIGGGAENHVTSPYGTIGGGAGNRAGDLDGDPRTGGWDTVGGGENNIASGLYATVPGGSSNKATGKNSFAAGNRAKAQHSGSFVWADDNRTATWSEFASETADQFRVRATGGVAFVLAVDSNGNPTWTCSASGSSSWSCSSDRELKENLVPVDGVDVLAQLSQVPIYTWNGKGQEPAIQHMGPMAQDFYAAFGLGEDERHLATIDLDGVALAAIQGLYGENLALRAEVDDLEARLAALEAWVVAQAEDGAGGEP